jgi:glutaredoxin
MDNKIVVFSKPGCPYCAKAKTFLNSRNLPFTEIALNPNEINYEYKRDRLFNYYNHKSYPLIVIDNKLLGGYSELINAYNSLELHKMCHNIDLYLPYDF